MLSVSDEVTSASIEFDTAIFSQDDNNYFFSISSSSDPSKTLIVPYVLEPHRDYEEQEFQCHAFISKKYYKENDIYQIYERSLNRRIGWIFPIQALVSREHNFSNNPHFLKYAFIAFKNILVKEFNYYHREIELNGNDVLEVSLDELFNTSASILCICNSTVAEINDFNVNNYLPSLYSNNYYYINKSVNINSFQFKNEEEQVSDRKTIQCVNSDLKNDQYLNTLFKSYLNIDQDKLVKFHLTYQIIELLIENVFTYNIQVIIDSATGKSSMDLRTEMSEILQEVHRINIILNKQLILPYSVEVYINLFNDFLEKFNYKENSLAKAMHRTRNVIVHRYREVINLNLIHKLDDINNAFEEITLALLLS